MLVQLERRLGSSNMSEAAVHATASVGPPLADRAAVMPTAAQSSRYRIGKQNEKQKGDPPGDGRMLHTKQPPETPWGEHSQECQRNGRKNTPAASALDMPTVNPA